MISTAATAILAARQLPFQDDANFSCEQLEGITRTYAAQLQWTPLIQKFWKHRDGCLKPIHALLPNAEKTLCGRILALAQAEIRKTCADASVQLHVAAYGGFFDKITDACKHSSAPTIKGYQEIEVTFVVFVIALALLARQQPHDITQIFSAAEIDAIDRSTKDLTVTVAIDDGMRLISTDEREWANLSQPHQVSLKTATLGVLEKLYSGPFTEAYAQSPIAIFLAFSASMPTIKPKSVLHSNRGYHLTSASVLSKYARGLLFNAKAFALFGKGYARLRKTNTRLKEN